MGSRGECVIRWNEHQQLLHGICTDLLASERFTDVTLFCEGMSLKCHRFILSACSSYFERILAETTCGDHPIIVLKDVAFSEMKALLQFVYHGELTTEESKLNSLIKLAQSLHIKGIGEYRDDISQKNTRKKPKEEPIDIPTDACETNLGDYSFRGTSPESVESNINSLNERILNFPAGSQQMMDESLSAPLDTDYNLQETEEFSFEPDPEHLDVSQPGGPQMYGVDFPQLNLGAQMRRDHSMESEAELSSDASFQPSGTPVYKQYTEQNLLAAIKAVLNDGMKQADASIKYSIPFTTLTRKIRLYQACGGHLPTKRRFFPPREQMHVMAIPSMANDSDASTSNENNLIEADHRLPTLPVRDSLELPPTTSNAANQGLQAYKQYSEATLRQAISAVLDSGMRTTDAAIHFGIPLTTLTRKVRSYKERYQGPNPASFCIQKI